MPNKIIGFSKLSREEKIDWLSEKMFDNSNEVRSILDNYLNSNKDIQAIHDSFSENSISNFYLPYSLSPNFLINNKNYTLLLSPMKGFYNQTSKGKKQARIALVETESKMEIVPKILALLLKNYLKS